MEEILESLDTIAELMWEVKKMLEINDIKVWKTDCKYKELGVYDLRGFAEKYDFILEEEEWYTNLEEDFETRRVYCRLRNITLVDYEKRLLNDK